MATVNLPPDFREFLKLLNAHQVEYLLIGGYAVAYYGYPRATADMDIWIAVHSQNAERIVTALKEFGFDLPELSPALFLREGQMIRMGVPPVRIDIATTIYGRLTRRGADCLGIGVPNQVPGGGKESQAWPS
ncbi:MAG: hypothetical protein HYY12_00125 [Candidatus Methylomirabilis oxyfera]|nr:hypothetical protein [Candidatus Methylomirabilis oxyfera]